MTDSVQVRNNADTNTYGTSVSDPDKVSADLMVLRQKISPDASIDAQKDFEMVRKKALLNILSKVSAENDQVDLSDMNLSGMNLSEMDFYGWRRNLDRLNLRSANLKNTCLHSLDLRKMNLEKADMRNVNLRWANLKGIIQHTIGYKQCEFSGLINIWALS